jgi:diguanylate cyclase (GGDEF)-like protein
VKVSEGLRVQNRLAKVRRPGSRAARRIFVAGLTAGAPGQAFAAEAGALAQTSEFWLGLFAAMTLMLAAYAVRAHQRLAALAESNVSFSKSMLVDPLTGVENRIHLQKKLADLFDADAGERRIGVCHLELEQLKAVTCAHGHGASDDALRMVAGLLRDTFGADCFIARIGGDEFIVVVEDVKDTEELVRLSGEVVDQLNSPIWIGAHQRRLGGLVGIALREETVVSPERLLMNADLALFEARKAGLGACRVFTDSARVAFESREQVLNEIHAALREDAFVPCFQPQIDAATGRHVGFEALARWRHPERGVLTPAYFLGVAEESGLIEQIGAAVLRKSLQALSRWRQAGFDTPKLGLNFSAAELRDPGFLDKLQWDLELVDLDPGQISIEVLESVLIDDEDDPAARNVAALGAAGYRIDLDDFGTGHASISNLGKIKVDRLKIDRSFVSNIDTDPERRKLADSILYIASMLGLETIAEGVETEGEMRTLIEMGCVNQQGYLHGRPMTEEECMVWMAENQARQRAVALSAAPDSRRSA